LFLGCLCEIYVNQEIGDDSYIMCGTKYRPCASLENALRINSKSIQPQQIILKGSEAFKTFTLRETIVIHKNTSIRGDIDSGIKPVVTLQDGTHKAFVIKTPQTTYSDPIPTIRLSSLQIQTTTLVDFESSGRVLIQDCDLDGGEKLIKIDNALSNSLHSASIDIDQSNFRNIDQALYVNLVASTVEVHSLAIHITNSKFFGRSTGFSNALIVNIGHNTNSASVKIVGSTFENFGQAIRFFSHKPSAELVIENSTYQKNYLYQPDSLRIACFKCIVFCGGAIKFNGAGNMIINNTNFFNNTADKGGALCLSGTRVTVINSNFTENLVASHGGAVYIRNSTVTIDDCQFKRNSASSIRFSNDHPNGEYGIGGAINNNEDGYLTIHNSNFIDNSAFVFGGSVYHQGYKLNVLNSSFFGPENDADCSLHGTLLYSKKQCLLEGNLFESHSQKEKGTVIFHSSDKNKLHVKSKFGFSCQVGQQIIRSYNHQPLKTDFSLFMLICKPCGRGTYSLQQEVLKLNDSTMANGMHVQCKPCPQGGVCDDGIRSLPSFWGWRQDEEIKFLPCPSSTYCCSNQRCISYDSCSVNRVGRLCGQCKPGFSESMFSHLCIPNEQCNGYMLWSIFVIISFAYIFIFMYFKDIFSMTKLILLKPIEFLKKVKSFENDNVSVNNMDMFYDAEIEQNDDDDNQEEEQIAAVNVNTSCQETVHSATNYSNQHGEEGEWNIMAASGLHECEYDSISIVQDQQEADTRERLISKGKGVQQSRAMKTKIKWYSYLFGVFKILVFFYQMQLLSKVPSVLEDSNEFVGPSFIKGFLTGIFNLKVSTSLFFDELCLFHDMDPVNKECSKLIFILLLFATLLLFFVVWLVVRRIRQLYRRRKNTRKQLNFSYTDAEEEEEDEKKHKKSRLPFMIRIKCCTLQLLLLGYSTVCTTSFELIHCEQINNKWYIYINANRECKGVFYNLGFLLVSMWSVPFFLALFGSNRLLRRGHISVNEFFAILFAPPLLVYYTMRHFIRRRNGLQIMYNDEEKDTREHVLQVLEMPFHKKNNFQSAWYWGSNLIFRRLILICIYIFFTDPISRLYAMIIPLSLFLVDHLRVQPYNIRVLNWLETASLLLLGFLISINLFWAYNYEANVPITNQLNLLSKAFFYVETFILFLPLLIVMCLILMAIARRVAKKLKRK
jgi:hypothetical protein